MQKLWLLQHLQNQNCEASLMRLGLIVHGGAEIIQREINQKHEIKFWEDNIATSNGTICRKKKWEKKISTMHLLSMPGFWKWNWNAWKPWLFNVSDLWWASLWLEVRPNDCSSKIGYIEKSELSSVSISKLRALRRDGRLSFEFSHFSTFLPQLVFPLAVKRATRTPSF